MPKTCVHFSKVCNLYEKKEIHELRSAQTCSRCSSLDRKAPDMKRLSRPLRSRRRRLERRGSRASKEDSVRLAPGRDKPSRVGPSQWPTWGGLEEGMNPN